MGNFAGVFSNFTEYTRPQKEQSYSLLVLSRTQSDSIPLYYGNHRQSGSSEALFPGCHMAAQRLSMTLVGHPTTLGAMDGFLPFCGR